MATDDRDMPAGAAGGGRDDMPAGPPAPHADNGRLDTYTNGGRGIRHRLRARTRQRCQPERGGREADRGGREADRGGREADQGGREAARRRPGSRPGRPGSRPRRPGSRPGRPGSRPAGMGTMTSSRTCHPGPIHSPRFTRRERHPTARRQPTRRMSPVRSPVPRPTGRARTGSPRTPPGRRPGDLRSRGTLRGTRE